MPRSGSTAAAVVLAGGSGTRLGADRNKVYLPLGDVPLLAWSLRTLDGSALVDEVVLVVRVGDEDEASAAVAAAGLHGRVTTVAGGPTRSASERAGLEALRAAVDQGRIDVIVIHDGARPFPGADLVATVVQTARRHGAAIPGIAAGSDLLTRAPTGLTPAPDLDLRRVQTPQAFWARELLAAYDAAAAAGFEGVDTAETVARFAGLAAVVVAGDEENLKVTTPADLERARDLVGRWSTEPRDRS